MNRDKETESVILNPFNLCSSVAGFLMHPRDKIIVIGAGHNGLVTAYYLAKAGFKPLVLERREIVGGACVTEEFHPGFLCSALATSTGPLLPQIIRDLQLERHGVEFIKPAVRVFSPDANG